MTTKPQSKNSLSSIGWRRGPGRGGTFCEAAPLLLPAPKPLRQAGGPLPTPASRGEEEKTQAPEDLRNKAFYGWQLDAHRLLMAGGIALAMLPTLFGRKGSGDSEVLESLLSRVNHLRQGQFPVRYRRLSVVEARAKLLAEARERLDKKSFFRNQLPT